ncbi:transposase [Streptomyces sp. NPDC004393]
MVAASCPAADPGPRRRSRGHRLAGPDRLHHRSRPPARRRHRSKRGQHRQDEPDDHALGRSRGGLTTKIHLACDGKGRPLAVLLTAGQRHDSVCARPLLERIRVPRTGRGRPRCRPDHVIAGRTAHAACAPTWDDATSPIPSRRSRTRRDTAATADVSAADHRSSTVPPTAGATSSNAGSNNSRDSAA